MAPSGWTVGQNPEPDATQTATGGQGSAQVSRKPFTLIEQKDYADKIEELQRDCNEFRWALATREDYLNELARLTEVRNALVLRMSECETCGEYPCECPTLAVR